MQSCGGSNWANSFLGNTKQAGTTDSYGNALTLNISSAGSSSRNLVSRISCDSCKPARGFASFPLLPELIFWQINSPCFKSILADTLIVTADKQRCVQLLGGL